MLSNFFHPSFQVIVSFTCPSVKYLTVSSRCNFQKVKISQTNIMGTCSKELLPFNKEWGIRKMAKLLEGASEQGELYSQSGKGMLK